MFPCQAPILLIKSNYPKTGKRGREATYLLETMLRIQLLHQWYLHSDPAIGKAMSVVATMYCLGGNVLNSNLIQDKATIQTILHLMEKSELIEQIIETPKILAQGV